MQAWRTRHTAADFEVDFTKKRLTGNVHLTLEKLGEGEGKIVLDTRCVTDYAQRLTMPKSLYVEFIRERSVHRRYLVGSNRPQDQYDTRVAARGSN